MQILWDTAIHHVEVILWNMAWLGWNPWKILTFGILNIYEIFCLDQFYLAQSPGESGRGVSETNTVSVIYVWKVKGVYVLNVLIEDCVSQSYQSKLWFRRLTHISPNGGARVSLISVSIGSVWRTYIRHPGCRIPLLLDRLHAWLQNQVLFENINCRIEMECKCMFQ